MKIGEITVNHRTGKRKHALNMSPSGSMYYVHNGNKRYVNGTYHADINNKTNNINNRNLNLLRKYYAYNYNPNLRDNIVRGYKKQRNMFNTKNNFEKWLKANEGKPPAKKKRVRPAWMAKSNKGGNKISANLAYNVNGQRINLNAENSQLF